MAEPMIIPFKLECIDVDTSGIDFSEAEKATAKALSGIKQTISDAFKGIDASAINKPIESAMNSVKKTMQSAEDAHLRYREAMIKAGKSTQEYKSAIAESNAAIRSQEDLINQLSQLGPAGAPHLKEARKELDELIVARDKINPLDFIDKAEPVQLEKITNTLKKYLFLQDDVVKSNEKFNQTIKDNKLTDEYAEWLKQAEAYKKKLEELDKKSKKMESVGATDRQWESLRYDTEQVSFEMDILIKKMRTAVTTGKAFRFGEGNKGELSRQINSLSMSAGNRAGNINARAMSNESPFTEDYQKALDELDKLEKKLETLREKSTKMIAAGASKDQLGKLITEAELLDVKIDEVKNGLIGMVNEGKAFKFGNGDAEGEISRLREKSGSLQSSLSGIVGMAQSARGGLEALAATNPKLAAIVKVVTTIGDGLGKVMVVAGKVAKVVGTVGKTIVKGFAAAIKVIGKVASAIGKVASGFVKLGKGIIGGIKNLRLFGKTGGTTSNDLNKKFKKLSRNILMWGFGFRTAYYAIKRLRTIFVESFKTMGDKFEEVGAPMRTMIESFNRLKGSLATAFQPLVSVVMPILTRFMNYLSGLLEKVGEFTAALTGQKYIYKAIAKDISSVAGAAKDANKQLGSYDKLEVIQKDDTGYDYEQQAIDGSASSAVSSIADMVKEAWSNSDFTEVGQLITEKLLGVLTTIETTIVPKITGFFNKLTTSLNTLFDGIDFTKIGQKVGDIVNELIYGVDWSQVGMLLANLNNIVWEFFGGLVENIDWTAIGTSLATAITSLFETLDLNTWATMVGNLAMGITTAFTTMFENVNWEEVGTKLGEAVNTLFTTIDIGQIGTSIGTLFTSIWTIVENFFATVDWTNVGNSIATGINNLFSGDGGAFSGALGTAATGLTDLLVTAITEIDWGQILDTLFNSVETLLTSVGTRMEESDNPIVSAFGSAILAIQDVIVRLEPAVKSIISAIGPIIQSILPIITALLPPIADLVAKLVQAVLPVLVSLFEAIMPVILQIIEKIMPVMLNLFDILLPIFLKIIDYILPIWLEVLNALMPVIDVIIETVLPVILHLLDALMPLVIAILDLVMDLLGPILSLIAPLIELIFNILDPIITILEPIISVLATLCDVLGAVLGPIIEMLTPIIQAISDVFGILGPLISVLLAPLNGVAEAFKFVASIVEALLVPWLNILKSIINVVMDVVSSLAKGFKGAFAIIEEVIEGAKKAVKTPLNAILGFIEKVANGVINGVNTVIKAMNKLSFDVPDWVPGIGGETFGFNIKELKAISIPKLAQGAVIPPNKEFLAMLGDQKSGTNIEAPLDTIKQALAEVIAEIGMGNKEPIVLKLNGRDVAKVVWDEEQKRYKQTGKYSPA